MNNFKKFLLFFLIILTIQTAYITLDTQVASTNNIFKLTNNYDYIAKQEKNLSLKQESIIAIKINSPKIKINMGALMTASVLFPGATLLKIAYCLDHNGISFANWLELLWILAIIDFFSDKVPIFASAYQFVQYPIIWATMYIALGNLYDNDTISILHNYYFIYPVVTGFQILKQAVIASLTAATGGCLGCGLVAASILTNLVALIIILFIC